MINQASSRDDIAVRRAADCPFQADERSTKAKVAGLVMLPKALVLVGRAGADALSCCVLQKLAHVPTSARSPSLFARGEAYPRTPDEAGRRSACALTLVGAVTLRAIDQRASLGEWYQRIGCVPAGEQVRFSTSDAWPIEPCEPLKQA